MARVGRILGVTFGLALAGASLGALCGVLAILPGALLASIRRSEFFTWADIPWFAGMAGSLGALLGGVAGPVLAWTLLRDVPLGRVFTVAPLGTVVGSLLGFAVARNPWLPGVGSIVAGGVAGLVGACVLLRVRGRRRVPRELPEGAV